MLARLPAVGGAVREPACPEAWTAAAVETLPLAPLQPPSSFRTDRPVPASGPSPAGRSASRFETESIAAGLSVEDASSWCLRIDAAATSVFEAPLPTPRTSDLREVEAPAALPFDPSATAAASERSGARKPAQHFRVDPPTVRFDKHAVPAAEAAESWADRLCQLQAQAAPYSGLIVTLALIVSAGLLYWLVLGPTSAALPTNSAPSERLTGGAWEWESTTSFARPPRPAVADAGGSYPPDAFTINALPSEPSAPPAAGGTPVHTTSVAVTPVAVTPVAAAATSGIAGPASPAPAVVVNAYPDAPPADLEAASPYLSTPYPAYEFDPRGAAPDMADTPTPLRR